MFSRLYTLAIVFSLVFATCAHATRRTPEVCEAFLTHPMPYVPQTTNYTCGPACLDSVARYWFGRSPGERELAAYMNTHGNTGTTQETLARTAYEMGLYTSNEYGMRLDDLYACVARGETVIVFWNNGGTSHFSVVIGGNQRSIFLMDPARRGPFAELPVAQFLSGWRGDYRYHNGAALRIGARPLVSRY